MRRIDGPLLLHSLLAFQCVLIGLRTPHLFNALPKKCLTAHIVVTFPFATMLVFTVYLTNLGLNIRAFMPFGIDIEAQRPI